MDAIRFFKSPIFLLIYILVQKSEKAVQIANIAWSDSNFAKFRSLSLMLLLLLLLQHRIVYIVIILSSAIVVTVFTLQTEKPLFALTTTTVDTFLNAIPLC